MITINPIITMVTFIYIYNPVVFTENQSRVNSVVLPRSLFGTAPEWQGRKDVDQKLFQASFFFFFYIYIFIKFFFVALVDEAKV